MPHGSFFFRNFFDVLRMKKKPKVKILIILIDFLVAHKIFQKVYGKKKSIKENYWGKY